MFKIILTLILIVFLISPANAYDWRTDFRDITQQRRNQRINNIYTYLEQNGAFSKDQKALKKEFLPYKEDKNYKQNLNYIKHGKPLTSNDYKVTGNYQKTADKFLMNYSLEYNNKPNYKFAYDYAGHLISVTIINGNRNTLPYWTEIYTAAGYLQKVSLFASDEYEYVFLANGDFQGVIIKKTMYNRLGRPLKIWML